MKVTVLKPKGYCAGVARAIDIALKARKDHPELEVSVLGMLVHNHHVSKLLKCKDVAAPMAGPSGVESPETGAAGQRRESAVFHQHVS